MAYHVSLVRTEPPLDPGRLVGGSNPRPVRPSQRSKYVRALKRGFCARSDGLVALAYKGASLSETEISFISIQEADEHARRRRPWARGLAPAALKGYDHIMATRVHQLVDVLGRQGGAVELGKWLNYFACVCAGFLTGRELTDGMYAATISCPTWCASRFWTEPMFRVR